MSKYHKPDELDRIGRLYRGEKKYHKSKDHAGKTTTLRDKRMGRRVSTVKEIDGQGWTHHTKIERF